MLDAGYAPGGGGVDWWIQRLAPTGQNAAPEYPIAESDPGLRVETVALTEGEQQSIG
jgi:hypothetical protein